MAEVALERTLHTRRALWTVGRFGFHCTQTVIFHYLCRCGNQFFFTWNETSAELRNILRVIQQQTNNVHLDINIDSSVHFLDAYVENRHGALYSRVHCDPSTQKYTLPYVVDHPKIFHSHWLRSALIRAVRYCTSVDDFDHERIYLEMACLANGYALEFVEKRIQHFFTHFDAASLRLALDSQVYAKLRHRLFNFISEQQQYCGAHRELAKNNQLVQLSYQYQFGANREFEKRCRQILTQHLNASATSSTNEIKIIFRMKHQYSLNALLSRQQPLLAPDSIRQP